MASKLTLTLPLILLMALGCAGAPRSLEKHAFLERLDLFAGSRAMLLGYYPLMTSLQDDLPDVLASTANLLKVNGWRAGAPYELSPGQLLRETLVTSGTMTNRVDRLERRGLVERLPDPNDRRGVLVRRRRSGVGGSARGGGLGGGGRARGGFGEGPAEAGGIVAGFQKKMTRRGDIMVLLQFEDLSGGSVEVIVFARTYEQFAAMLRPDAILLVKGRLDQDVRDDSMKMMALEFLEPGDELREVKARLLLEQLLDVG
mgnify:CR=1 FL=1